MIVATFSAPAGAATGGEGALLRAMNGARAAHGLGPLRIDRTLTRAARSYTRTMIHTGRFTHGSFARRLSRFGARGPVVGENLAWGVGFQATPAGIVRAWLRSPGHRRNLLRPGFRRVGIGSLYGRFAGHASARVVAADFAGR